MTDAAILATQQAWNQWGSSTTKNKISNRAYYIANHWNSDIAAGNSSYEITVYNHYSDKPVLSSPSDTCNALSQSQSWLSQYTSLFSTYDCLVVLDNRTYGDGATGCAYQNRAGTNYGVGYVNGNGGNFTAGQELGHTYGGKHAATKQDAQNGDSTFESTATQHSIMGNYGQWDCNINHSYTYNGNWYSNCTQTAVRNYIDNNGL